MTPGVAVRADELPTRLRCAACGHVVPADEPRPYRCPRAGTDDGDHVLWRELPPEAVGSPAAARSIFLDPEPNPFVRYRRLFHSYHRGLAGGLDDTEFVELVRRLDAKVAGVDGRGFRETPFGPADGLAGRLGVASGALWIKDETGNVSGSHKARHFMGVMLWIEVARRLGLEAAPVDGRPLAVASCGNAAVAAAVLARAGGRPLEVFVPPEATPSVIARLTALRSRLVACPRDGEGGGDPCFRRLREAVADGALPFTCQGTENALVTEGGATLVWEMLSVLLRVGRDLDHLFVQVGGGALAGSCVQALLDAGRLGLIERLPRIHTVQTRGAFPLRRAWERLAARVLGGRELEFEPGMHGLRESWQVAARMLDRDPPAVAAALRHAASHRSRFMWPWEEEPRSLARGILDDETYDWLLVMEGMLATGGVPVVVAEGTLRRARRLARGATGIPVDATGAAGLAGYLTLLRAGLLTGRDHTAVLFTGRSRRPLTAAPLDSDPAASGEPPQTPTPQSWR